MKGIAFNSISRVLVIVFQLINIKLYTYYLNADQLGISFFLLTVSYSANALLFVPVDYFQQAKLAGVMSKSGGLRPFLRFNKVLAGCYFTFFLLVITSCAVIRFDYVIYIALVSVFAFFLYVVQALRNTFNNLDFRGFVSVSFIQEAILKVLVFYWLVNYFKADECLLILSWLISLILSGIYLCYKSYKIEMFAGSNTPLISAKDVYDFSYPFSIGAVCNWLQLQGYRLILVPLGFAEEVGIFATLSSVGSAAISAVSLVYSQQFTPLIYKTAGEFTGKYLQGAIIVLISVTLVSLGVGEFVVKLLTNSGFELHWKLLLFGVLTDGSNLIVGALIIHTTLIGSTRKIILFSLLGLLVMEMCFGYLYWESKMSLATIGVPLLVSQWIIVFFMYLNFNMRQKNANNNSLDCKEF
ncbi:MULTISPECIES: hypothetical protein [Methylomonas]|uniref:Polysaccharide biosynthesis protein n=2 Tax=Methylomonas TaxID=416 RepID=A0A140E3W1_9GAMM|nr:MULTISPECIES: hypothetical protein [Methylomonas]AMK75085.1 hypothetical protein JT25_001070 [Methylomonas denitrificans]OAI02575.1 hypothetical protein A1342_02060 [Methylomonas methanica]TCV83101.1 hypothetical protein EDE11_11056 [Methylomonas methanica]